MVGQRIKAMLAGLGVSQAELSRKMGIPEYMVSNWIRGRSSPSIEQCQRIAAALNIPASDIIDDQPAQPPLPFPRGSREQAIVDGINDLDESDKDYVLGMIDRLKRNRTKAEDAAHETASTAETRSAIERNRKSRRRPAPGRPMGDRGGD